MFPFRFRMKCINPLSGNILQLNMVTLLLPQCVDRNAGACKNQLQNKLKDLFDRLSNTPLIVQFDDNRSESITMKLCSLTELTGRAEMIV